MAAMSVQVPLSLFPGDMVAIGEVGDLFDLSLIILFDGMGVTIWCLGEGLVRCSAWVPWVGLRPPWMILRDPPSPRRAA